jgi:sulfide:quinone oxidoreductase
MTRRVVILGGGAGGLVVANSLASAALAGVEVLLVDRSTDHFFQPGLVAVLFGEAEPDVYRRPLRELIAPGIELLTGEVQSIDPEAHLVTGSFGELGYDDLVIALGADVGGASGSVGEQLAPWTLAGALAGRRALERIGPTTRVVVGATSVAYRCPPAVFDLAVRIRGATGARVEVVHPWPAPLAPFGEQVSKAFAVMLETASVRYRGDVHLETAVDGSLTDSDGNLVDCDVAFIVPAHHPPDVVARSSLAGENGWPRVSFPTLTHPAFTDVSIVGDLAAVPLGVGMAGTLAISEGRYVADRLAAAIEGALPASAPVMSALCFVDTGRSGSLLACDFTGPASGTGPPSCVLLPMLAYFRRAKQLFADEWFSDTIRCRTT